MVGFVHAKDYIRNVDPIVWRKLALGSMWLVGALAGIKWCERQGMQPKMVP